MANHVQREISRSRGKCSSRCLSACLEWRLERRQGWLRGHAEGHGEAGKRVMFITNSLECSDCNNLVISIFIASSGNCVMIHIEIRTLRICFILADAAEDRP